MLHTNCIMFYKYVTLHAGGIYIFTNYKLSYYKFLKYCVIYYSFINIKHIVNLNL